MSRLLAADANDKMAAAFFLATTRSSRERSCGMAELAFLSIRQAGALLARGETSSLDLVEACLKQIDRFESRLQAWVVVDADGARAQARRLDEERARGAVRGPLHGIPIAIKDIIDVAGLPTLGGSPL